MDVAEGGGDEEGEGPWVAAAAAGAEAPRVSSWERLRPGPGVHHRWAPLRDLPPFLGHPLLSDFSDLPSARQDGGWAAQAHTCSRYWRLKCGQVWSFYSIFNFSLSVLSIICQPVYDSSVRNI